MAVTAAGPLPVYLLTGFLGSGKTTLLSRLVRSPRFADTAVIINEFGEIGLDHMLVGRADDSDVVLLDSGCLCCAATSSLQDTLESLYYRRQRGEIPAFTRVVVETSGLADPCPVINTLAADPLIARHYRFGGVVATADALHGMVTLDAYREASTQIAIADRIALTKTDLADEAAIEALRSALRGYNASAPIRAVSPDTVDEDAPALFDGLRPEHLDAAVLTAAAPLAAGPLAHVLRYGIVSYAFPQSRPVGWEDYARWTRHMQRHIGDRLLRAKGLLRWTDGTLRAVHGVRHVFATPEPVTVPEGVWQKGAMVLIVQDLSSEDVDEAMRPLDL
ncbi:CobW/HypB/UreG, nucleotide-binding domain protein 4 [Achromobacter xylosoxidans A8]|uniref:CobW/HypB/UreG, nucleotide-binding domain protein 4 n=1 Tax=Achromobacter xylosoxidans (strain A8) TaxID=762376 RepID=E3HKL4_ACHXA|nr:GTP-binding protein [Achromobacter xylosoxidans]ADP19302.1 CobW/HypB/UreG, nucleotide-binding domain protein 4 [Achromobacter xylosoxidans A8]